MNSKQDRVLNYATPPREHDESRAPLFVGGFVLGEVLSLVLLVLMQAGGPIFPYTLLYAPMAVITEAVETKSGLEFYLALFVGGPLMYGLYGLLIVFPKPVRNLLIALSIHLLCFAITLWQRDVFSVL